MIFRRFTYHVKKQDWFAVGLDLCVVIVGIFLGLQVNEWNEARKNRHSEVYYLQQLVSELEANIVQIEQLNDATTKISEKAGEVERLLSEKLLNDSTINEFIDNAYYSFFSDHTRINTVTSRLLTSEIGSKIVQSRELKKILGEHLEIVNGALKWEEQWLSLIRSELVKIHHGIGWRGKSRNPEVSFEEMMTNEELKSSYAFVSNTQYQLARNRGRILRSTETLLNHVKGVLVDLNSQK